MKARVGASPTYTYTPDIMPKLKTALRHVLYTFSLGATNCIEDLKRTSTKLKSSTNNSNDLGTKRTIATNLYVSEYYRQFVTHKKINEGCWEFESTGYKDPQGGWAIDADYIKGSKLHEKKELERLHLSSTHLTILLKSLLHNEKRVGNCGDRTQLLIKYLWEHSQDINSIEFAITNDFDHGFVIVNRDQNSDLDDSDTWGDAYVIDPWYQEVTYEFDTDDRPTYSKIVDGKLINTVKIAKKVDDNGAFVNAVKTVTTGIIFHASEFNETIKKIKAFAIRQTRGCEKLGVLSPEATEWEPTTLRVSCLIQPQIHHYPGIVFERSYRLNPTTTCHTDPGIIKEAKSKHVNIMESAHRELRSKFTNNIHLFYSRKDLSSILTNHLRVLLANKDSELIAPHLLKLSRIIEAMKANNIKINIIHLTLLKRLHTLEKSAGSVYTDKIESLVMLAKPDSYSCLRGKKTKK